MAKLGLVNRSPPGVPGDPVLLCPQGRLLQAEMCLGPRLGWECSLPIMVTPSRVCLMQQLLPQSLQSVPSLTAKAGPRVSEPTVSEPTAATLPDSAGQPAHGPGRRGGGGGDGLGRGKGSSVSSQAGLSSGRVSGSGRGAATGDLGSTQAKVVIAAFRIPMSPFASVMTA